jgi:DNA-binding NarL/FixJ family response regulator
VAAASRPALLVLDTSLPGGAAWSLLKKIKSRWPHTHASWNMAKSARQRETAQAAGADGVLVKGFSTAELYVMIDELLACPAGNQVGGAEAGQSETYACNKHFDLAIAYRVQPECYVYMLTAGWPE